MIFSEHVLGYGLIYVVLFVVWIRNCIRRERARRAQWEKERMAEGWYWSRGLFIPPPPPRPPAITTSPKGDHT